MRCSRITMSSRIISIEKRLRVLKDFLGNLETIYAADRVPQGAEDHSYIGRINHLFKEGLATRKRDWPYQIWPKG